MPRRPQKDSKRRKGPSGPEQLARKQAREASDAKPSPADSPAAPLEEPMDEAPSAVEAAAQDAGPEDVAAPAPTPAPARRAPLAGARAMPQPAAFRVSRQSRQQADRLSIPSAVQAQLKGDLMRIGAITVVMVAVLGALTVVLG